jgi:hypothetical protein
MWPSALLGGLSAKIKKSGEHPPVKGSRCSPLLFTGCPVAVTGYRPATFFGESYGTRVSVTFPTRTQTTVSELRLYPVSVIGTLVATPSTSHARRITYYMSLRFARDYADCGNVSTLRALPSISDRR